jgi:hypothetical protein
MHPTTLRWHLDDTSFVTRIELFVDDGFAQV